MVGGGGGGGGTQIVGYPASVGGGFFVWGLSKPLGGVSFALFVPGCGFGLRFWGGGVWGGGLGIFCQGGVLFRLGVVWGGVLWGPLVVGGGGEAGLWVWGGGGLSGRDETPWAGSGPLFFRWRVSRGCAFEPGPLESTLRGESRNGEERLCCEAGVRGGGRVSYPGVG